MSDADVPRPPRRPRYRGTHPRAFAEKYKEHHAEAYPADVARILESGKTPAGTHRPIMVGEILDLLRPQPGDTALDCTLGYGGHAQELLKAVQPGGRLLGIDADPVELAKTEARLKSLGFPEPALMVKRMNFAGASRWLAEVAPDGADVILADLGVSSMQIDDPARGFTFKTDGPLDMRLNPQSGIPAAQRLLKWDAEDLVEILSENADEPYAELLAGAVVRAQRSRPITTTAELATIVRRALADEARPDDIELSVRRVFQAIRITVNDEFGALQAFLSQLPFCLKPGGRVAILTFHSGEDRRVKKAFQQGHADGVYVAIAPEVIRASMEEQRANPRSSSAKLRYAVRAS
ncbi:MAG TPA: 16S rRNA (cytosine(1402)-N(4))-methyltransferase RsmH [Planctomycetaceae bacterium]|nr:16S rRNA (cytosine(1402)-N(4))-methyltransferase RsmH [Planctomycetaceae bacterium]